MGDFACNYCHLFKGKTLLKNSNLPGNNLILIHISDRIATSLQRNAFY